MSTNNVTVSLQLNNDNNTYVKSTWQEVRSSRPWVRSGGIAWHHGHATGGEIKEAWNWLGVSSEGSTWVPWTLIVFFTCMHPSSLLTYPGTGTAAILFYWCSCPRADKHPILSDTRSHTYYRVDVETLVITWHTFSVWKSSLVFCWCLRAWADV